MPFQKWKKLATIDNSGEKSGLDTSPVTSRKNGQWLKFVSKLDPGRVIIRGTLPIGTVDCLLNVLDAAGNVRIAPAAAYWKFGLASVVFLLKPGLIPGGANNCMVAILRFNRRHVPGQRNVTNK